MEKPKAIIKKFYDFHQCAKYIAHKYGYDFKANILRTKHGHIFHHYVTDPDRNFTATNGMPQQLNINKECVTDSLIQIQEVVAQFVDEFGEHALYENDC